MLADEFDGLCHRIRQRHGTWRNVHVTVKVGRAGNEGADKNEPDGLPVILEASADGSPEASANGILVRQGRAGELSPADLLPFQPSP